MTSKHGETEIITLFENETRLGYKTWMDKERGYILSERKFRREESRKI
jgi:hypothetical protein